MSDTTITNPQSYRKRALQLIVIFGLVSLFGDIIYEGARSVNGQYLKTLGANAAIVGMIAGLSEFLGYGIRLASGYFADKTRAYWVFTFLGYAMLISVPLLSIAGSWQMVGVFIVMERLGKALRSPARDTIVSQATKQIGTGFGFGIQEAMDQIGAIAGPLIFSAIFFLLGSKDEGVHGYQNGYALMWIPFFILMICISIAYRKVPDPAILENSAVNKQLPDKLSRVFWLYTVFGFLTTLGFINFAILGFHFKAKGLLSDAQIPFFYAIAMAIDGIVALVIGKYYDILKRKHKNDNSGLSVLIAIPFFSFFIAIFAFSRNYIFAIAGICIWGVVMGAHETIMKSAIADITSLRKRGTGYGIFNASYGLAMFFGSALMGFLYDYSITALIVVSCLVQLCSVPLFILLKKEADSVK